MSTTLAAPMQLYGEYHERQRPDCVVLVHPLGQSLRFWDGLLGELTPTHAVIALDLRGHGLSWAPQGGRGGRGGTGPPDGRGGRGGTGPPDGAGAPEPGAEQHAEDVAASVRALGRTSVAVVGAAGGALVALALEARHPELVRGLGLVSPPPGMAEADDPARAAGCPTVVVPGPDDARAVVSDPGGVVGALRPLLDGS